MSISDDRTPMLRSTGCTNDFLFLYFTYDDDEPNHLCILYVNYIDQGGSIVRYGGRTVITDQERVGV